MKNTAMWILPDGFIQDVKKNEEHPSGVQNANKELYEQKPTTHSGRKWLTQSYLNIIMDIQTGHINSHLCYRLWMNAWDWVTLDWPKISQAQRRQQNDIWNVFFTHQNTPIPGKVQHITASRIPKSATSWNSRTGSRIMGKSANQNTYIATKHSRNTGTKNTNQL